MTALKIDPPNEQTIAECLVAGRRAAYGETLAIAEARGLSVKGDTFERYLGANDGNININGFNIVPVIDAAVIETIARMQAPAAIAQAKRPWWKVWA